MTTETFLPGQGPLYRMDPRTKLLVSVAVIVCVFLPVHRWMLAVMMASLVVVSLASVGRHATWVVFRSILPMLIFMVLFMPFGSRDGRPLWVVGRMVVLTWDSLWSTLTLMYRFVTITYACTLFFSTTRMHYVMCALQWFRLPFKAVLVITLAFSTIPFVSDSFREIADSHRLRQASDGKGKRRMGDMLPTLTSALVVSLRSIPFLAMSLEQRGYGREGKRTQYHDLSSFHHGIRDGVVAGLVLALVVFVGISFP